MIDVDKAIATAVKTGKVVFGADEALRSAKTGKARLILVASNSPSQILEDIEYYGKLSRVPVVTYDRSNLDLGIACGKRFAIAVMTVKESGDSDILKLSNKSEKEIAAEE